ncbi:glycosyltransferase [Desulfohalovibrio reitneri]|uniref:glycosyltransferase n=1 Tax=Desulfohalovibrio reitneri TaxID=1307759 RepID=UPI000553903B|nr:glycosyltransferase [Desulfohalovibrio reitneri]
MRVCMFTNTYLPHVGGVARSVDAFSRDLAARGHEVLVVAPTFPDKEDGEEPGPVAGVSVFRVPAIQNFNGSDFSVRLPMPFRLSKRIDGFNPDLIHSHHPFLLGDAALRAAEVRGLPVVFTHHTMYERYTHYVLETEAMKRFVIQLSTGYANLVDRVVAPSESVAEVLRRRKVKTPIRVVPTGVDTKFFASGDGERFRVKHGIETSTPVVGHLGRLAFEKNLDYLGRAVAEYLRHNEGVFLVAGNGPAEKRLRNIFSEEKLKGHLLLVGMLQGDDLADCYKAMDVFTFASTSETQGMVLTEAMASGTPVVALDAPGAREVVEDGRNGRLLPEETKPEDFASAIGEALEKSDSWRSRAAGRAEEFSRDTCAEKLLDLYREILAERPETERPQEDWLETLEIVQRRLRTEWDMLGEKAKAALEALEMGRG